MTENQYFSKIAIDLIKDYTERGYENAVACIDWLKKISQEDSTCPENQGDKNPCKTCEEPRLNCQNFPCKKKKNFDSINKVKPKFHEGNWILYSGDHYEGVRHITKINENGYYIERNGLPHGIIPFDHEICMRLWTIQDAKDGDVLVTGDWVFIFGKLNTNDKPVCYCHYDVEFGFSIDVNTYISTFSTIHPATKEQRDTLMKAMADAGYTFDFEKKELKKIEEKHAENKGMNLVEEEMTPFQKKVFSIIDTAIEEEQGLKQVCDELFTLASNEIKQKPAEWSEEDERTYKSIMYSFDHNYPLTIQQQEFVKSIRPQNHWKPTEEQVYTMKYLAKYYAKGCDEPTRSIIEGLYEQLKQL